MVFLLLMAPLYQIAEKLKVKNCLPIFRKRVRTGRGHGRGQRRGGVARPTWLLPWYPRRVARGGELVSGDQALFTFNE